jgi:hypothetical protein
LALLSEKRFKGPNEEYLTAHEHYRHGRHKECLVDCLKAFKSTIKTICDARGWTYDAWATAKDLIAVCFDRGLFPTYLQSQLGSLRSLLESGVPTVRNRTSGHGQGVEVVDVPEELAGYGMHLTASNILLIVEADKKLK